MKKAYIQPEIELLKVSALNDFLIGSPDGKEGIDDAEAGDGWVNDNNGDEFGSDSDDAWA